MLERHDLNPPLYDSKDMGAIMNVDTKKPIEIRKVSQWCCVVVMCCAVLCCVVLCCVVL
jgi:hypothetical protein